MKEITTFRFPHPVDEQKIAEAMVKKIELKEKILNLRLEMAKINQELVKAGASINEIAAW